MQRVPHELFEHLYQQLQRMLLHVSSHVAAWLRQLAKIHSLGSPNFEMKLLWEMARTNRARIILLNILVIQNQLQLITNSFFKQCKNKTSFLPNFIKCSAEDNSSTCILQQCRNDKIEPLFQLFKHFVCNIIQQNQKGSFQQRNKIVLNNFLIVLTLSFINYYYLTVKMNQCNPIQEQVSRILHSEAPTQLVSQLKYLNSYESRVQQELKAKSEQIAKLQNYLKEEIANIQAIVTENNSLKKENEALKNTLAARNQEMEKAAKEMQMLTQINKESSAIIRRLEEEVNKIQSTKCAPLSIEEAASQTDPIANAVPSLLDKIASLQEMVMQLKFEKNTLQQKLNSFQEPSSGFSLPNQSETSIQQRRLTTAGVLQMVAEGELRELRFRGEMLQGLKQGRGVCEYQEGIVYQGDFHQGRRHGHGALLIDGQTIYRGEWRQNLISGKGRISMLQGQIQSYEGHFSEGRLQGYGCMKLKSGKRITALWKDGKILGKCLQVFAESKRYRKPELIQCY